MAASVKSDFCHLNTVLRGAYAKKCSITKQMHNLFTISAIIKKGKTR